MKDAIIWDRPYYYVQGKRFIPKIGENTTIVSIDGRLKADLNWKNAREEGRSLIEHGQAILWEIDLGLFSQLAFPLTNQSQYLSLGLSLEHFRDTIWKEFQNHSIGLSIFRGPADFSNEGLERYFEDGVESCRDVAAEYLSLLAARLPDAIPVYVSLEVGAIDSLLQQAILLHPERWESLNLHLYGCKLPILSLGMEPPKAALAICLPPMESDNVESYTDLGPIIDELVNKKITFRLIAESHLTTQWDGLDQLIYLPEGLSAQGQRKLNGFRAAGGEVIPAKEYKSQE